MNQVSVCLSPRLLGEFDLQGKVAVVTDIFRATTCIVTACDAGAERIKTFTKEADCRAMRRHGYLLAGERDGIPCEGFDLGNSPLGYLKYGVAGKKIAITTTNGTFALEASKAAEEILIGAFVNLSSICDYLATMSKDVVIVCAAWKGRVNFEDSAFAGAVVERLSKTSSFEIEGDEAKVAMMIRNKMLVDHAFLVDQARHGQRLKRMGFDDDIAYCLTENICQVVPVWDGEDITLLKLF